jgi:diguanylate cyclase (GGDEF)-like protein
MIIYLLNLPASGVKELNDMNFFFYTLRYSTIVLPVLGIALAFIGYGISSYMPKQLVVFSWLFIGVILMVNGFFVGYIIRRLHQSVFTDRLTKIGNRSLFYAKFRLELDRKKSFTVAILDIDNFKKINDTYGHIAGDKVLLKLAQVLKHNTRSNDTVIRWGGEEFALILPNTNLKTARLILERLRIRIQEYDFGPAINSTQITVSMGIVCNKDVVLKHKRYETTNLIESIMNCADKALYKAKLKKNQIVSYSEIA